MAHDSAPHPDSDNNAEGSATQLESASARTLARVAWIVPAVLFLLSGHQLKAALDLADTRASGKLVWAEVVRYERSDRKDVTMVELDLRARMPDGSIFERNSLALPYSVGHRVEAESLLVRIDLEASQEVVIDSIARTQVWIARSNAAMALIAGLLALWGVRAWNQWLRTH
ncbi:MAG: hypothetical protein COV99_09485 [Bacteroidetes bacterium CG12_big_fil_rev_8_21_14_0_65_60_17]|nr:MAG: hypothetical protein COV99_09485 [Bacteroidetes bacterium CG12_big_fil_rev_8_21_14_0_65_60_17]